MSSATSDDDVSDWQSLKRQADGVVNLAVGHPHPEALPNAILARAFERAAAGLVAPSDASVDGRSARVPMSYVARRGDPAAIDALATGRWQEPTLSAGETVFLLPGGTYLSAADRQQRLALHASNGWLSECNFAPKICME